MKEVAPSPGLLHFDAFEVDLHNRELRKHGIRIRLQDQPFHILQILLEHPGELVSRDELQRQIWPVDTFVDFERGLNNAIKRLRDTLGDSVEHPRFIETIPKHGYRFLKTLHVKRNNTIYSLAVLPLDNCSRDPEQEYFADGLSEALITNLAKINALRVVSRTTAWSYKGTHLPLREIARELHVDAIVEGTVARSGECLRISVRLVNGRTDDLLWAQSYDRDLRDVLEIQSEVALAVVREIRVKLTPQEQTHLAQVRAVNPEAYEAYLKGRYHWNKRNGEGVRKCAEYFQEAIEKDPTYAAAYAGLADAAGIAGWWGSASPEMGCARAKVAALKSLEIEETAEAHASLGWATLYYDWDAAASEKEFLRAIELNPIYATGHQWYSHCLGSVRRFEEAFAEAELALRLEPLSLIMRSTYAGHLWCAHRTDEAIQQCDRILELDPYFPPGYCFRGIALAAKGMHEAAIKDLKKGLELSGGIPIFLAMLGHTYATAGHKNEARKVLQQLEELSLKRYVSACYRAFIYCGLNEKDEAFHWLERGYRERAEWMMHMRQFPAFCDLSRDPRYENLLRRMKLSV